MVADKPTLSSVSPKWRAMVDKWATLCRREDEIILELQDIWHEQDLADAVHSYDDRKPDIMPPPKPPAPLSPEVSTLLGDVTPAPDAAPSAEAGSVSNKPVVTYRNPHMQRAVPIAREWEDIKKAKAILLPLMEKAQREGSKKLAEVRADDYRAVARKVCDALVTLADALNGHADFLREIRLGGAEPGWFRPLPLDRVAHALGDARVRQSPVRHILTEAAERGAFDLKRLPVDWTKPQPEQVEQLKQPPRERRRVRLVPSGGRAIAVTAPGILPT